MHIPDISSKLEAIEIYHEPIKQQQTSPRVLITNQSPVNVFILEKHHDGVWEAHHLLWNRSRFSGQQTRSGERLSISTGPSPRYISTVMSLLRPKLEGGEPIRIVASKRYQFWEVYSKLIQRMLRRSGGRFVADPPVMDYRSSDGMPKIAQVIRPAQI